MLIRILETKEVVTIDLGYTAEQEQAFLDINNTGNFRIINSLPEGSLHHKYKLVNDEVVVDEELEERASQDKLNNIDRQYLSSTDWYITRNTETGIVVPADILTKRQAAREAIV